MVQSSLWVMQDVYHQPYHVKKKFVPQLEWNLQFAQLDFRLGLTCIMVLSINDWTRVWGHVILSFMYFEEPRGRAFLTISISIYIHMYICWLILVSVPMFAVFCQDDYWSLCPDRRLVPTRLQPTNPNRSTRALSYLGPCTLNPKYWTLNRTLNQPKSL